MSTEWLRTRRAFTLVDIPIVNDDLQKLRLLTRVYIEHADEDNFLFSYTINVAEQTMVLFVSMLQSTPKDPDEKPKRYTDMQCAQLIVDSWLSGGGTQPEGENDNLRYFGIKNVDEPASKLGISREVEQQMSSGLILGPAPIEILSSSPYWRDIPWISVTENVAIALSTPAQEIRVSRVWIVIDRPRINPDEPEEFPNANLVLELTATAVEVVEDGEGGDGED